MHTHQDAGKRNKTYMIVFIVSIIFLVSFSIRALYLNALITNDNTFSFANGVDSSQYVHLAENIVYLGRYSQDSMESRHIALLRTPGFPFFYAVFEYFGLAPKYVLYVHVIIGSLIPVLASLLIFLITKNILTTLLAGLLCGFSASGILMTGEVLVDLLFSFLFFSAFLCFYIAMTKKKYFTLIMASILFGISAIVKPVLFLWPFYSIIIFYVLSKSSGNIVAKKKLILFVIIQMLIIGAWCQRNYLKENIFTLSSIGLHTLRIYLAVEIDVSNKNERINLSINDIKYHQNKIRKRIDEYLKNGIELKEIQERLFNESINILKRNPIMAYQFFAKNILEKLKGPMPWWVYKNKIHDDSFAYKIIPVLIAIYSYLMKVFVLCIVIFFLFIPLLTKKYSKKVTTNYVYIFYTLFLVFLYFTVLGGFTFWTGPRIVYPAYLFIMCMISFAGYIVWTAIRPKNN